MWSGVSQRSRKTTEAELIILKIKKKARYIGEEGIER
jgi:hypothetical protein